MRAEELTRHEVRQSRHDNKRGGAFRSRTPCRGKSCRRNELIQRRTVDGRVMGVLVVGIGMVRVTMLRGVRCVVILRRGK